MEIRRRYNEQSKIYDYKFIQNNKMLVISFQGNLDLYFSIHGKNINERSSFFITKENMFIYNLFEKLFNDIENINLFDDKFIFFEESEEDLDQKQEDKRRYRLFNRSNYNELFDDDKVITWYSDETAHEVSNYLKIKREDEYFKLSFYTQQYIRGYDRDFNSKNYIPIRFRNSGSRYEPFNICFMRLFNNLQEYDPDYHQITIEEYNQRVKKLNR